jgi:hypothetical protein
MQLVQLPIASGAAQIRREIGAKSGNIRICWASIPRSGAEG